jgi:hypothetical protein
MSILGSDGNHGPGFGPGCGFGVGGVVGAGGAGSGAGAGGSGAAGGAVGGSTGFGAGGGAGGVGSGASGAAAGALLAVSPSGLGGVEPAVVGAGAGGAGAAADERSATGRAVRVVQWRGHESRVADARSLGFGAGGRFGCAAECSAGSGRDDEDVDVMALPPAKSAAPVTITAPTALRNVAFTRFPPREKSDRTHRAAGRVRGAAVSGRS